MTSDHKAHIDKSQTIGMRLQCRTCGRLIWKTDGEWVHTSLGRIIKYEVAEMRLHRARIELAAAAEHAAAMLANIVEEES